MGRILVTGGAGFIGSNLCEKLAANPDNEVWSLDNYSTGSKKNHVKDVQYIKASTHDVDKLRFKPDTIYHLGEYSRVEQSFEDIDTVFDSNFAGTQAVLEFALKHKAKLIYAGSSTKFGDGGEGPNQSPYAFTKSTNTQLVQNYGRWFDLDYAITYFYNAYGNREITEGKYATVIAKFCKMYSMGLPLTVTAPGSQKRNFTHIDDIISGLVLVGEQGFGDGYGIGSPEAYSILEIAEMFGSQIDLIPGRPGNRMTAEVVSDKTKGLGWEPKHSIKDYIKQYTENGR